jgi:hypothetical protein
MADATTDVNISGDNETLGAILQNQYGRLKAEEARTALETAYEKVWNETEFAEQFEVSDFVPPYAHVIDKQSRQRGTVLYLDAPRFYFLFNAEHTNE